MFRVKRMLTAVLPALLLLMAGCGAEEDSAATVAHHMELQAHGMTKLVIDHRNGEIHVTGSVDSDKIEVVPLVKTNGASMDKLELKLEAQEDTAYLEARFKGQFLAMGSGAVDLEIQVPEQLQLEIRSHRDGNIHISDLAASANIANINGDIQVSNLTGLLEIDNRDGDITVQNLGSDVMIHNLNGHLQIDHVDGSAEIHVGDGSLDIDHVAQDLTITQSGKGQLNIGEVQGQVFKK